MKRQFKYLFHSVLILVPVVASVACVSPESEPDPQFFEPPTTTSPSRRQIEGLETNVARAEMILEGVVVQIQYRESATDSPDSRPIPHTFVTYRIDENIKGRAQGAELTLRFIGGPSSDGRILLGSGIPLFQVGDHDILLVQRNGISACPLVGCGRGRYRILGDAAYPDDGSASAVPEFRRFDINGVVVERQPSTDTSASRVDSRMVQTDELRTMLGTIVEDVHTPEQLANLQPVHSFLPESKFTISQQLAANPPEPLIGPPAPRSLEDLRELEAYERTRHQPVQQQK